LSGTVQDDSLVLATLMTIETASDGVLHRDELRQWAEQLIERGHFTPSICTLALDGTSRSESEVRELATLALRELDIQAEKFANDGYFLCAYLAANQAMSAGVSDHSFLSRWGEFHLEDRRLWTFFILSCGVDDIRSGMGFSTHVWGMTDANWQHVVRRDCEEWLAANSDCAVPLVAKLRACLK
jgi:hypothetical protein